MLTPINFYKEVASLPSTLEPNSFYLVRRGTGFDLHATDSSGLLAHKLNNTEDPLSSPVFTYNLGNLTGITYVDGSTKIFSYVSGQLTQIDHLRNGILRRKTFNYSGHQLQSITETLI
jgi:hypothetical protein